MVGKVFPTTAKQSTQLRTLKQVIIVILIFNSKLSIKHLRFSIERILVMMVRQVRGFNSIKLNNGIYNYGSLSLIACCSFIKLA